MTSKLLASTLRHHLTKSALLFRRQPFSTATAAAAAAESQYHEDSSGITMKGVKISGRSLYLDVQASSPVDPRVTKWRLIVQEMSPLYEMVKDGIDISKIQWAQH